MHGQRGCFIKFLPVPVCSPEKTGCLQDPEVTDPPGARTHGPDGGVLQPLWRSRGRDRTAGRKPEEAGAARQGKVPGAEDRHGPQEGVRGRT